LTLLIYDNHNRNTSNNNSAYNNNNNPLISTSMEMTTTTTLGLSCWLCWRRAPALPPAPGREQAGAAVVELVCLPIGPGDTLLDHGSAVECSALQPGTLARTSSGSSESLPSYAELVKEIGVL
jgi:hypothetical protein